MDKKELRKRILKQRSRLSAEEVETLSEEIIRFVIEDDIYIKARDLCLYMPVRNEVDINLLIKDATAKDKNIWLPKVEGDQMEFCLFENMESMKLGAYDILEPISDVKLEPDDNTLVIMPGAVFSRNGNRIGYGGGYYDRYLAKHSCCNTIAVCYSFQVKEEIPTEPHDIKPDRIICDTGIVLC